MFGKSEKLCKSVIDSFSVQNEWRDEIFLGDACKERFLSQSDFPEFVKSHLYMAGQSEISGDYHVERIGPDFHTLLFTNEGGGVLITESQVVTIDPHTVTFLPPNQPFRFEIADKKIGWRMSWLLLQNTSKWNVLSKGGRRVEPSSYCEQVWSILSLLYNENEGRGTYRKLYVSELSRMLLGDRSEESPSDSHVRVQSVFNEVESQLHYSWTVKSIAERCFLSVEQLNRITKQLFGCSTQQRLISLRMERAADLLLYESWSVTMIAQRLGYPDPFNFTHRFTRYHGCSPREFRKNKGIRL
ncbi:AraC-type DNA-binding domain-containing protein [Vibrio nigripulchritudo ATCC 27043]|uniref:AraC-type DNA-binding domain-containing protein n=1 Tax=Vibrio nigripulchritudo SOn1 TaxID=1238450 RepID=A0AAV2VKT2_9VIBR|nr:AraC family transcriptional regulator [Vibrio nigripulchritudo]EGU56833.1 AraC-type DNA-binding domain-containing protein [Vibrio nigripulchritudo ATCC 27043]CCN36985.1 putative AraC-type DNA-binding domain-containing protein [Vibrio nigripulchritudo AM115]CCN41794.1 putative AraC-type DNA-binding domain-containing protein [Vibrio nigripulchritudo FTn2]CCN66413.1 putative AraC-type DNA-binding domain-containing protein [Vibrio nigripulchritudo POn4]CCN74507.1 putative AraC-type DNA-binding 